MTDRLLMREIRVGDWVRQVDHTWLGVIPKSQHPPAPAHHGRYARGKVAGMIEENGYTLAVVNWEDEEVTRVAVDDLERILIEGDL